MSSESYRNETLGHLEAWLTDAINSDTTSKDVYDTLVNTVKTEIKYHSDCQKRAENLLLLLKGNLSALYDKEVNGNWYSGDDGKVDMGGRIESVYSETNVGKEDVWNNFSSSKEGEEWVKENGGYEYTPPTLDSYNAQHG